MNEINTDAGKSNTGVILFLLLVAAVVIGGFEAVLKSSSASLIFTLVYFTMIAQGCVAVVAAAETALGRWIRPVKRELLSVAPLLWLLPVLFVFMYFKWALYPRSADPNAWHNPQFFVLRNVVVLLVAAAFGNGFASASLAERSSKSTWSIFYLISWVVCMSFVAFDWVMPLEYPWVSTLLGAYFFVESFFMGLCVAAVVLFAWSLRLPAEDWDRMKKIRKDIAVLMFGLCIVWGHHFFSQYLVIWYGNLLEFNSFFVYRLEVFGNFIYIVPVLLFAVPFLVLLTADVKFNPWVVLMVALTVLFAIALERFIIIRPLAPLFATTGGGMMILGEFAVLGSLLGWFIWRGMSTRTQ